MEHERIDEALELIWTLNEDGFHDFNRFHASSDDIDFNELFNEMLKQNMILLKGEDVFLTEKGFERARGLIRRQRLAEQLFTDVFELKEDSVQEDACKMEHILSEELTDRVCTFLGHPPKCPHGKPIPRGECCKKYKVEVEPLVVRLTDFEVGSRGRIIFIVSSETSRLNKLSSMGITAGSTVKLLQKKPSYVIQIEETSIALDPDISKEIYVKRVS